MKIRIKLTDLLAKRQITQSQLMRQSGLSMGTINAIARGRTDNVTLKTLESICKSLDCRVDELLVVERE